MKIGGPRFPVPSPGSDGKAPATIADVAKTRAAAGQAKTRLPDGGDSFERAGRSPLASLLGKGAVKAWGDPHAPDTQRQLAGAAGRLLAQGDAAGGLASWTNAVQHDPGFPIAELLPYALRELLGDLAGVGDELDPDALVQRVVRESGQQATTDPRSFAETVLAFNEARSQVREMLQGLRGSGALDRADDRRGGVDLQPRAELDMAPLNILMSQRQQLVHLATNLVRALSDSSSEVARNTGA